MGLHRLWLGGNGGLRHLVWYRRRRRECNADVVVLLSARRQRQPRCRARAGTLIHEARHVGGKPHDAQFPANSVYGAGGDGADSSWGYEGAWMYNVLYLWWFYAAGQRTTVAMRQSAKQRANIILANAFANSPGFIIA